MTAEIAAYDASPARPGRASGRAPGWPVAIWLLVLTAMVVAMVLVGGLTRLTDSGLSITEWRPVTGALPPFSEAHWLEEFEKYRQIPEYQLQNAGMSLAEFQQIYWWEWAHRFLGRAIGIAFLIPFLVFLAQRRISLPLGWRLAGVFALGGVQGAVGWWMVASGLTDRLDVSQYRLAAHLGLAFLILALLFWTMLDVWPARRPATTTRGVSRAGLALGAIVFLQILLGAFVAGLDAWLIHNTWPLMDGGLVPALPAMHPSLLFEDRSLVQFNHRMGGYAVLAGATALVAVAWRRTSGAARRRLALIGALSWAQVALGIVTLLTVGSIHAGAAHQAGAVALFLACLSLAHIAPAGPGANSLNGSASRRPI
jgi:cytochrome c oxidase assembly protein subunit 15